ncbi:AmmeMemoRadiSam system protein B [Maribacter sp. CXY002]|uniref:AmmeMemoRadiSam system protein B n=1 Tax=Maribacter luteocoastalis TaxID=3407671 RepID=UPI003B677B39
MKKTTIELYMRLIIIFICLCCFSCKNKSTLENVVQDETQEKKVRLWNDAIGYTKYDWQLDSIYSRLGIKDSKNNMKWKAAICPHDAYKYSGRLYYESLKGINANTIILVGVAHFARNFDLQDKIIFGDFTHWESPYGDLKVSDLNSEIIEQLPQSSYIIHNEIYKTEHSIEGIVPFLHRKNKNLEIIPILVPYINYETIEGVSNNLSNVVSKILKEKNLEYGKDVAIVISNDAVHYGNEGFSSDLAPFGVDDKGIKKARALDMEIIEKCLVDEIGNEKVKKFTEYTVQNNDYKEYKWVWCGRYSVPFGVSFANKLNQALNNKPLSGTFLEYETSIDHDLIKVEDLGVETKTIANQNHWVAYTSIKFE